MINRLRCMIGSHNAVVIPQTQGRFALVCLRGCGFNRLLTRVERAPLSPEGKSVAGGRRPRSNRRSI